MISASSSCAAAVVDKTHYAAVTKLNNITIALTVNSDDDEACLRDALTIAQDALSIWNKSSKRFWYPAEIEHKIYRASLLWQMQEQAWLEGNAEEELPPLVHFDNKVDTSSSSTLDPRCAQ